MSELSWNVIERTETHPGAVDTLGDLKLRISFSRDRLVRLGSVGGKWVAGFLRCRQQLSGPPFGDVQGLKIDHTLRSKKHFSCLNRHVLVMQIWWWTLAAFVAALVLPIFWLLFFALALTAITLTRENQQKTARKPSAPTAPAQVSVGSDEAVWEAVRQAQEQGEHFTDMQLAQIDVFLQCRRHVDESMEIARNTQNEVTRQSRLDFAKKRMEEMEELVQTYDLPVSVGNTDDFWLEYYDLSTPLFLARARKESPFDEEQEDSPVDLDGYIGKSWGEIVSELTGGANLVDGKQTWELAESHKHDLPTMLECCRAELKTLEQAGQLPAPYYFERSAILLRKQKEYDKEVQIIELYLAAVEAWNKENRNIRPNGGGARHDKIVYRLAKAKQLASKNKRIEDSSQ